MSKLKWILWVFLGTAIAFYVFWKKVYAQSFVFSTVSNITDGNPKTFSEISSDKQVELNFEVNNQGYEGRLNQIRVLFRTDTNHPLPKRIKLKVSYDENYVTQEGDNTRTIVCMDTFFVVNNSECNINLKEEERCYLRYGNLEINFEPFNDVKYLIEDIFIEGSDFRIYEEVDEKPVIYLYPTQPTEVTIQHLSAHQFTFSYPKYEKEWKFKAFPNGDIENEQGKRFPYLFWEGLSKLKTSFKMGYCVKRDSIVAFLEDKLAYQGLNYREITDFITYWGPRMQSSPYYLIYFANQEFDQEYPVKIFPKPDCKLRVFMIAKPSFYFVKLKEQPMVQYSRKGFAYIEWGGKLLE